MLACLNKLIRHIYVYNLIAESNGCYNRYKLCNTFFFCPISGFLFKLSYGRNLCFFASLNPACWYLKRFLIRRIPVLAHKNYSAVRKNWNHSRCAFMLYVVPVCDLTIRRNHSILVELKNRTFIC